jgi:2-polyprenyl-3-methyl-5-hydroxy-6-metoxy-1,4-benzoquinol methylase
MLNHDAASDWKRFGETNPYFGVLSDPSYRGRALNKDTQTKFFRSGQRHVDLLFKILDDFFPDFPRGRALDFGCGVGRITQALASKFGQVVGLDIAPGMLAEARRNAEEHGVANIEYHSSLDGDRLEPGSYDLVHSYLVLQHIPVRTGEPIIEKLVAAVRPGGVGALHMTIVPAHGHFNAALSNFVKRNRLLRILGNLAKGRRWDSPAMEMNLYRTERIVDMLARSGIERFHCVHVDDWGSVGLFFTFRKEAGEAGKSPWSNPVTGR